MRAYNFRLAGALYEVGNAIIDTTQVYRMVLRKSTNDGASWSQFVLTDKYGCAYSVLPNPKDDNVIYVGGEIAGSDGYNYAVLFKTTNKGTTWSKIGGTVLGNRWESIRVLECEKNNPNRVYAGTNTGLFRSTDAGSSWYRVIDNVSVSGVVIDPSNANIVYAGTSSGVKLSTDGGSTWRDFNENLRSLSVESIEYDSVNKVLYVGTRNAGVFRRNLGPAVGVEDDAMPARYELYQNYPNPFNPATTIKFAVPNEGTYRLTVHNVLGQEVAVVVDGRVPAGRHSVQFDAQDLSSGTYFYRLEGGASILTRKMLIIK